MSHRKGRPSHAAQALVPASPWPHRLAWGVALVTFPLIWVGGLVTTYDAGMAVPDWPTTFGYNLFLYPWSSWIAGPWDLFIEHGHRLLGAVAGAGTLLLAACVWRYDQRFAPRLLSLVAVPAVVLQGVLGGMRVLASDVRLARLHGCTGPLFFTITVLLIWATSGRRTASDEAARATGWGWSGVLAVAAYLQLVLGAFLRHVLPEQSPAEFRIFVFGHLAGAVAVTLLAGIVFWRSRMQRSDGTMRRLSGSICVLVALQLALGTATWIVQYNWPTFLQSVATPGVVVAKGFWQSIIVTGHVANGSLILALSVLLAARGIVSGWKQVAWHPFRRLGGSKLLEVSL